MRALYRPRKAHFVVFTPPPGSKNFFSLTRLLTFILLLFLVIQTDVGADRITSKSRRALLAAIRPLRLVGTTGP